MHYAQLRYLAVAVAVLIATIGFVQVGDATVLGIPPRLMAWLGILGSVLGVVQGFLPTVQGMATKTKFLEHRINELPVADRKRLATRLANHATVEARLTLAQQADDERRVEHAVERRLPHG